MMTFSAHLEARNPARNRWRAWRIEAGRDLLGDWIVDVSFGRIGARGRTVRYAPGDAREARRLIRAALRRRGTAHARIGVDYEVRELVDLEGWSARQPTAMELAASTTNTAPNRS